jgi:hypothetical protein
MRSTTTCTAAVTRSAVVTRRSNRNTSLFSSCSVLTSTTPSIFRLPVTTCDAQELHISDEISSEISSMSAAAVAAATPGAAPGACAGEPQANATATNIRKGAKRTFVIVRLAP